MLTKCQEKALKAMNKEYAWIDKADNTAIILRIYDDDEEE